MFLQIMQEDVAPPLGDDHDSAAGELFEVPILGRVARGGVDHELPVPASPWNVIKSPGTISSPD